jgi:transglutaminase-like putative cysteine protease
MFIRAGYEILFDYPAPTPVTALLAVLPERFVDLQQPDLLRCDPAVEIRSDSDIFGNRSARFVAPGGPIRLCTDFIIADSGAPGPVFPDALQHEIQNLPVQSLQFLLPSRYCEVDCLQDIAWNLFGSTPSGWPRVQAICDWVHSHVEFGYQYARSTKTALETYQERQGVCRDFTHLAVAFCRCMNIPTRYATGYLGDVGVPPNPAPMDFSACFQVYLGGRWHTFDARHNARRIGWILIATGRDAADCAITTSYGPATLVKFTVWTEEVSSPVLINPRC